MSELQEAGDDVLTTVYRRRTIRELRSFASLARSFLEMGVRRWKASPQKWIIRNTFAQRCCWGLSSGMWRYVSMCFPTFRKERSAFMCTAQAFLERTAFLRCWLFFVDYLALKDDSTTSKNRQDPETQCNFPEHANRPSCIIPYFPLHKTLKVIRRTVQLEVFFLGGGADLTFVGQTGSSPFDKCNAS